MNEDIDRLEVLRSVGLIDRTYYVSARATYYPNKIKVFVPFRPYAIGLSRPPITSSRLGTASEEDKERSINRTKGLIRDYVLCNRFDLFGTFTFRDDRFDIGKSKTKMANWLKNQSKRYGKFKYLIIPERHKKCDTCAREKLKICPHDESIKPLHFHALFRDYKGKLEPAINPKTGKPVRPKGKSKKPVYSFSSYTLGFSNTMQIGSEEDDYAKVAKYVTKYITKDMPVFLNKKRFWVSHGLKAPIYEENPAWYQDSQPYWTKVTQYGMIYLYERNAGIVPEGLWD